MKHVSIRDIALATVLIVVAVLTRVAFQHVPNFAPVAAIALFAGCVIPNRWLALSVPLLVMLVSDALVDAGGYEPALRVTVYGLLALPVFFRGVVHQLFAQLEIASSFRSRFLSVAGLLGCSASCSVLFFLGTNAMVWATSSWYEPSLAGLASCFTSALPFFRYTFSGDVTFATILFGGYAAVTQLSNQSLWLESETVEAKS